MTLRDTLISIWRQILTEDKPTVDLAGKTYSVGRTRAKKLRMVRFVYGDYQLDGIEQNPVTTSQWAALAREGKRIMQFSCQNRYVANVCEGNLTRYAAWHAMHLPEGPTRRRNPNAPICLYETQRASHRLTAARNVFSK